jgi:hypothetical protein
MKLKIWEAITGAIRRIGTKVKFFKSQIKNPNF